MAVENAFRVAQTPEGARLTARVQVSLAGRYALSAPLFRLLLPMLVGDALHAIKRMLESDAARGGVEE